MSVSSMRTITCSISQCSPPNTCKRSAQVNNPHVASPSTPLSKHHPFQPHVHLIWPNMINQCSPPSKQAHASVAKPREGARWVAFGSDARKAHPPIWHLNEIPAWRRSTFTLRYYDLTRTHTHTLICLIFFTHASTHLEEEEERPGGMGGFISLNLSN